MQCQTKAAVTLSVLHQICAYTVSVATLACASHACPCYHLFADFPVEGHILSDAFFCTYLPSLLAKEVVVQKGCTCSVDGSYCRFTALLYRFSAFPPLCQNIHSSSAVHVYSALHCQVVVKFVRLEEQVDGIALLTKKMHWDSILEGTDCNMKIFPEPPPPLSPKPKN